MADKVLFNTEVALAEYKKRKAENDKKTQIDNSALYAGSPMHYYCKHCGEPTETLPEAHMSRPKTVCDACQALVEHGVLPIRN
jgi:CRISPR/Cas system-associated protein Cas10 (large subunit of type III CRISPR-Cas system)